jgi:hypothetical protein
MRTLGVMAVNGLEKVGANLLGAVANDVPSGSAYPYYGGSSQFIPRPRAMPMRVEVKPHGKNGDALNPPRPMDRITTEALAIAEPDWAADSH